jgi:hypothetical protein
LETLPAGDVPRSAYRELPNVVITPGIAGPVGTVTRRQALFIGEEFERCLAGRPLVKPVTAEMRSYVA